MVVVETTDSRRDFSLTPCVFRDFRRLQSIEAANESLRSEAEKHKSALETIRTEKTSLEQRVSDLNVGAQSFKDEIRMLEAELRKSKQREKDNEEVSILL